MIVNEFIIYLGALLLTLALLASFLNPFFRVWKLTRKENNKLEKEDSERKYPKVSVLVVALEQTQQLKDNLLRLLKQDYPNDFEVIVMGNQDDNETIDILKQFSADKHLYCTFIPRSSRYMSRHKLAITLGVKAAKFDWILLTETRCYPESDKWLCTMTEVCKDDMSIVMGYANYNNSTSPFYRFEHLHTACYQLYEGAKSKAFRTNSANLLFKKQAFINGDGFVGNLNFPRGEFDYLVNKYAQSDCSAISIGQQAKLVMVKPLEKEWMNEALHAKAVTPTLHRRWRLAIQKTMDALLLFAYIVVFFASFWVTYQLINAGQTLQGALLSACVILSLIILLWLRLYFAHKTYSFFNEQLSLWKSAFYLLRLPLHWLNVKIHYVLCDQHEFTTHKI